MSPSTRSGGRPPRITRQQIIDAARRIVDAEGLQRLTMRRLATEVGAAPMALYHHVRNKDDLLLLLMADFSASVPRPRLSSSPRQRLITLFTTIHDNFSRCPWIVEVLASDDLMDEAGLWYVDEIIGAFREAGLAPARAVHAYRTVWYYTVGEIVVRTTAERRSATSQRPSRRAELMAGIDAERYPQLASVAPEWAGLTARDTYRDGLRATLAGLLAEVADD